MVRVRFGETTENRESRLAWMKKIKKAVPL